MSLTIMDVTKRFKKRVAVDHFSMEFQPGVYGLLGPNGAGKTTLLRSICGLYRLDGGAVQGGENPGYLPQSFGMFRELTLFQMMEYLATLKGLPKGEQKEEIHRVLELVNLCDRADSRVKALSGGMVRRAGIAQALLGDPEVLLFDEPTAGLDPEERMRFQNVVAARRRKGVTLISTHIVSDVETLCHTILILNEGKLVTAGTASEIAQLAQGKVYLLPGSRETELRGAFFIKSRGEENGASTLRVLSRERQPGEVAAPTMEDGYLCAIKGF